MKRNPDLLTHQEIRRATILSSRQRYEPPPDWQNAIAEGTMLVVAAATLIAFALAAMEVW
jgi:hypothetical protein